MTDRRRGLAVFMALVSLTVLLGVCAPLAR